MSINPNIAWANNSTPLFSFVGATTSPATTSASNVLYYNSNGLAPISITNLIANSFDNTTVTIPSTYFPSATTTYRLTASWRFDDAVFNPTPTTGVVGVQGQYGGASTAEVDNANSGGMRGTFSAVFLGGNNVPFVFYNGTLATITSGTLTFTSMSISAVTTSNVAFGAF
jgi:hypothetical protein